VAQKKKKWVTSTSVARIIRTGTKREGGNKDETPAAPLSPPLKKGGEQWRRGGSAKKKLPKEEGGRGNVNRNKSRE